MQRSDIIRLSAEGRDLSNEQTARNRESREWNTMESKEWIIVGVLEANSNGGSQVGETYESFERLKMWQAFVAWKERQALV